MAEFHTLKVREVKKATADTVVISMDVPENLQATFAYTQGQYLTFRKVLNNNEVRRSYSLCSSPATDKEWKVAVKKVLGGKFSEFANDVLKAGDELEVMAPMGNFFSELKEGQKKKYMAIAAGSGITPIISIIKSTLAIEKESTFTLYYGNRRANEIIFRQELESLKEQYPDRFRLILVMSADTSVGEYHGRISADKCDEFSQGNTDFYKADEYFLCGPEHMIFDVQDKLIKKGVDARKVHFELFNTPVQSDNGSAIVSGDHSEVNSMVTIILDGEEISYPLSSNGPAILDAAMDAGADAPFSCKGAVCCTCRAKLLEGKVHMEMNYALTDQEVEEGYILTCQSHPLTEKVVVDYDAD